MCECAGLKADYYRKKASGTTSNTLLTHFYCSFMETVLDIGDSRDGLLARVFVSQS